MHDFSVSVVDDSGNPSHPNRARRLPTRPLHPTRSTPTLAVGPRACALHDPRSLPVHIRRECQTFILVFPVHQKTQCCYPDRTRDVRGQRPAGCNPAPRWRDRPLRVAQMQLHDAQVTWHRSLRRHQ